MCLAFLFHVKPERQNTYQSYLDFKKAYIPRGQNVLQCIFKDHFADFKEQYDDKYAKTYEKQRKSAWARLIKKVYALIHLFVQNANLK
jgi:hypothetical protein